MAFGVIDSSVVQLGAALRDRFASATPFPHVVVDDFLRDEFARQLLAQFPPPDDSLSPNRYGAAGGKAFRRDLQSLGPAYQRVHAYFGSAEFLEWLGTVTGIAGLTYDEGNFGGGTHENFDGRDLRPHIDFNYHPITRFHRRVNLIIYLNEGWQHEWGGSIALHSDPRDPLDRVTEYVPLFNRCIIFETSERSWHGFDRIVLPADQKHRTRKSLSIYFYTRERPECEMHREHTTFFIPRPFPARFTAGYTLSEDDAKELGELIGQRDRLIELYQREQGRLEPDSAQAARLRILVAELRAQQHVPIFGYACGVGAVSGWYPDGWSGNELRFSMRAERTVRELTVRALIPQQMPLGTQLCINVNGKRCVQAIVVPGRTEVRADVRIPAGDLAELHLSTSATVNPKQLGMGPDERDLGFFLESITLEHAVE